MKHSRALALTAGAVLALAPVSARAANEIIQGRTGLATVQKGENNVWIEHGLARIQVVGNNVRVTQEYRLQYPGPELEKGAQDLTVAFREDYYRGREGDAPEVTPAEARGFTSFRAWVDGRPVNANMTEWQLNEKKDTATRWRQVQMQFQPGQTHRLRVISVAPLGQQQNKKFVAFVGKDIGHWRDKPDYLEIRVELPGATEAFLAGLEPKPDNINRNGVRWVYRKADPNRDVFILLPPDYRYSRR